METRNETPFTSGTYSAQGQGPHHFHSIDHDPDDIWGDSRVVVNIGPTHPAMHGALRMVAKVNGETIEQSYCEFGFTHRAKEKLGENRTYHQFIVYSDRLNYCSALINNVAYAMSVERLLGVSVPERCVWIRMIASEMARVIDHLVCVGIGAVDIGAFSFFLYGFHQREEAYTLIEKLCGARLTTSYTRIGGLAGDAPVGWEDEVKAWVKKTRECLDEMDSLLTGNKIWLQRTVGVARFSKEDCLKYSFTGPCARAAGIDIDLRRDAPYLVYDKVEFDVPIAQNGDVFDRYLVRMEEIRQSLNIIQQCAERMKPGPVWADDKRTRIPDKEVVHNTMEGLIHHFKFFMTGFDVPEGEAYTTVEAANGELGFYICSKGGPKAHRMRIRGPSVYHFQALSPMSQGGLIADMVAALGSINIIAGELDR
ncbi:MAG: NADH-quinone oxidoreductase subunit D [Bdellovibrionales bacterium]|nr:NADH-quinone oxidoreductase subunit D [Bdellovibrionales bacterium]